MTYDPEKHHRHSIRLRDYDYSQAGAYYVTIVTFARAYYFGNVSEGEMHLSAAGQLAVQQWMDLPRRFGTVDLDAFVVMPNHIHAVTLIYDSDLAHESKPKLGQIVRTFKAVTAYSIRKLGLMEFTWQRNYYEHIIRNERELAGIQQYINDNPLRWLEDDEYLE